MFKKINQFLIAMSLTLSFAFGTTAVVAADPCQNISGSAYCENISNPSNPIFGPDGLASSVTTIISIIGGVISVVVLILSGISFITASGDTQKIAKAKNAIIYSAIGLVVSLAAASIVEFIVNRT